MTASVNSSDEQRPLVRLCFLPNWEQTNYGEIKGGARLIIEYARERIYEWPGHGGAYGPRDWWHYAHLRFHPGGPQESITLFYPDLPQKPSRNPAMVTVPAGAEQLEIWFEHVLYHFEPHKQPYVFWDSRYGENYWFTVTS